MWRQCYKSSVTFASQFLGDVYSMAPGPLFGVCHIVRYYCVWCHGRRLHYCPLFLSLAQWSPFALYNIILVYSACFAVCSLQSVILVCDILVAVCILVHYSCLWWCHGRCLYLVHYSFVWSPGYCLRYCPLFLCVASRSPSALLSVINVCGDTVAFCILVHYSCLQRLFRRLHYTPLYLSVALSCELLQTQTDKCLNQLSFSDT